MEGNEYELRGNCSLVLKRSVTLTDTGRLNLNTNAAHRRMCWMCVALIWMMVNYKWLVERLHVASLTSQWSGSLAGWLHRLACWVLDGLQISLIGLCSLTPFSLQPWSASSLVPQNVSSLWLAQLHTGMSGDRAVNTTRAQWNSGRLPMLQQSSQTQRHTHTQRKSNTLSVLHKAPMHSVTHLKSCVQTVFHCCSAQKFDVCKHKHA